MLLDTGSRLRLVRYDDCSLLIGLVGGYQAVASQEVVDWSNQTLDF